MAVYLHSVSVDQSLRSIQYKAVECIAAIDALKDSLKESALQMLQGIVTAAEKKYRPGGAGLPRLGPKAPVAYVIIDKSKGNASTVLAQHMTSVQQPPAMVDKGQQTEHSEEEKQDLIDAVEITEIPAENTEIQQDQQEDIVQEQTTVQDTSINYEDATFLNDFDDGEVQEESPPGHGNMSLVDAIISAEEQVVMTQRKHTDPSKIFECSKCKKVFHSMYNMKAHIRVHTGEKPYACPHCDKKFGDQSNYRTHLRRHEARKPYKCEICNRGFERLYDVRRHKEAIHCTEKGPMYCAECGKNFKRMGSYRKHIAICGVEMFQTPVKKITSGGEEEDDENCAPRVKMEAGESTSSDGWNVVDATPDVQNNTTSTTILRYQCETCNKTFSSMYNLRTHVRTHTGERPYQCEFCERSFSDQSNFKLHVKRHARERPHKCDHCDQTFERYFTLRRHLETHKSTRYKCGHCGEIFEKYNALGRHMNVHREEIEAKATTGGGKRPASVQLKLVRSEEDVETPNPIKKRRVAKSRLKIISPEAAAAVKVEKPWCTKRNRKESKDKTQNDFVTNVADISTEIQDDSESKAVVTVTPQDGDEGMQVEDVESVQAIVSKEQEYVTIITEAEDKPVEEVIENVGTEQVECIQSLESVPGMANIVQQLSDGTIVLQDTSENAAALALAQFSSLGQNVAFSSDDISQDGQQTIYILAADDNTTVVDSEEGIATVAYVVDQESEVSVPQS